MTTPYLTRNQTNEKLGELGFKFELHGYPNPEYHLVDSPVERQKFQALIDLIGGAIAEWADVEVDDTTHAELQEWAEEWLVG